MVFSAFFASLNKVFGESFAFSFQNNTETGVTFNLGSLHSVKDIRFKPNGSKFFMLGSDVANSADKVYEYDLTSNWDISTASFSQVATISSANGERYEAICFNFAGTKVYLARYSPNGSTVENTIKTFDLSTAWDISTISNGTTVSFAGGKKRVKSMNFNTGGTKLFMASEDDKTIYEYTLTAPFDVSGLSGVNSVTGASASYNYSTLSNNLGVHSFQFTNNGLVIYLLYNNGGAAILELSTAFDLSTISVFENFTSSPPSQLDKTGTEHSINLVDPPAAGSVYLISSGNIMYENQF